MWGILGGIAHAGAQGNVNAKVRALKLNAIQLRIADAIAGMPDGEDGKLEPSPRIAICDNKQIYIEPLSKTVLNDIKL